MSRLTWTKEARKRAREEKKYLLKTMVNGYHAEDGPFPRSSISVTGVLPTPEHAYAAMALCVLTPEGDRVLMMLPKKTKAAMRAALRKVIKLLE